jgi:hypothetical protein
VPHAVGRPLTASSLILENLAAACLTQLQANRFSSVEDGRDLSFFTPSQHAADGDD